MATFLTETFTDSDGTNVVSHTADTGQGWVQLGVDNGFLKTFFNHVWFTHNAVGGEFLGSGGTGAASANYRIDADFLDATGTEVHAWSLFGRFTNVAGALSYYRARFVTDTNSVTLSKSVAATGVSIDFPSETTLDTGTADVRGKTAALIMNGSAISVVVDGVTVCTATDTDVTATGIVAFGAEYLSGGSSDPVVITTLTASDLTSSFFDSTSTILHCLLA